MSDDAAMRETKWVIKRVMPLVPKNGVVAKAEFEAILDEIVMCVHRNRKISIDEVSAKTTKILTDLPDEYGTLPKHYQSWEALIGYYLGNHSTHQKCRKSLENRRFSTQFHVTTMFAEVIFVRQIPEGTRATRDATPTNQRLSVNIPLPTALRPSTTYRAPLS
jgi:hypothetical protein